jgi:hypothetical protein
MMRNLETGNLCPSILQDSTCRKFQGHDGWCVHGTSQWCGYCLDAVCAQGHPDTHYEMLAQRLPPYSGKRPS